MKGNILIVDDNPDNLSVLEGILAADGHEVRPAVSGEIALKAVAARLPDLILLDIMMPGLDGFEVCRRLKDSPVTAAIPVLFISALDETGDKLKAFEAGGLDYITKPFAEREVLARVQTHLRLAAAQMELLQANRNLNREIRSRKESERNLIEAQRIARVGNWSFDLSSGCILSASDECYSIFGLNPEKFPGTLEAFLDVVHPDDRDRVESVIENFLNDYLPFSIEFRIMHSGGPVKMVHVQAEASFDSHGNHGRGTGTVQDISEQREAEDNRLKLERKLLRTQKLESIGTIAGGIAHNFNNLLMAIIGNLDLTLFELPPGSSLRGNINKALTACERAASLTRQMLAYSGKGLFTLNNIDLNDIIRNSSELFQSSVSRNITLDIITTPNAPLIKVDEGQIQQVIMNLLINASEAVGDNPGSISLSTGIQDCDDKFLSRSSLEETPPAGRFVYLEVSDTGCGMEEETRQRIFDPFFTTKFMGRGLGMSSVQGIVQAHKGAIVLESEPGCGSTFRVFFPVIEEARQPARKDSPATDTPPPLADFAGTVLVADDEEQVREMCMTAVKMIGFRAIGVVDGMEAVNVFKEHADDIDLVILDLTMPNMDGIRTFYELKRIRPEVRVILNSGYSEQCVFERFNEDRPAGFIQKPYHVRDMQAKISQVMKNNPHQGTGNK